MKRILRILMAWPFYTAALLALRFAWFVAFRLGEDKYIQEALRLRRRTYYLRAQLHQP